MPELTDAVLPAAIDAGRAGGGEPTSARGTALERSCEALIEACWLAALVTVPLFFNVYSGRIFEPDKVALLRLLTTVMTAAWLAKVLAGGRAFVPVRPPPAAAAARRARPLALLLPLAALVASAALSTALSLSPWRSFFGSFQRQQGLLTTLCYAVVFAAVLAHLRRAEQWRRTRFAIVVSSLPAAAYAVLQRLGRDPVGFPHDDLRVSSTLGNPIFLGAFLVMTLLVTADALADAALRARAARRCAPPARGGWPASATVAALAAVMLAQLAGLVLTESRGPVAGLLAGAALAALLAALAVARPAPARPRSRHLVLLVALAGACLIAGAALLVGRAGTPAAALRDVPLLGRLASALDTGDFTRRVRTLIWDTTVELVTTAPPLRTAAGAEDPLHAARRAVGYGPECFDLAFNRVYPAALGRIESRNAVPDRAHDEAFDLLVTQGAAGVAAWLWLFAAVLGGVLGFLGLDPGGRDRPLAAWWIAAGAAAGVALTMVARQSGLAGPALTVGTVAGAAIAALMGSWRRQAEEAPAPTQARTAILLAAVIAAHLVETAFGIAVTPTRLLLFLLLAVLVAELVGWVRPEEPLGEGMAMTPPRVPAAGENGDVVARLLLVGWAVAVTAFGLTVAPAGETGFAGALVRLLSAGAASPPGPSPLVTAALLTLAIAVPLALLATHRRRGGLVVVRAAATVLLAPCVVVVLLAFRFAATAGLQRGGAGPVALAEHVAGHAPAFALCLLAFTGLLALALAGPLATPGGDWMALRVARQGLAATLVIAAGLLAFPPLLRPLRADTMTKHANAYLATGDADAALALLARARELAPRETAVLTATARAAVGRLRIGDEPATRALLTAAGIAASLRAERFEPLDPDHPVNHARVLVAAAAAGATDAARAALLSRAAALYREGLVLRPQSVLFRVELAGTLLRAGDTGPARAELRRAIGLDPTFEVPALMLAGIEHGLAGQAAQAGRPEDAARHLRAALATLKELLRFQPDVRAAAEAAAALHAKLGDDDAVAAYQALLVGGGESAELHQMLALLAAEAGDRGRAVRHARKAVELAPPALRPQAEATLRLVEGAPGEASPQRP